MNTKSARSGNASIVAEWYFCTKFYTPICQVIQGKMFHFTPKIHNCSFLLRQLFLFLIGWKILARLNIANVITKDYFSAKFQISIERLSFPLTYVNVKITFCGISLRFPPRMSGTPDKKIVHGNIKDCVFLMYPSILHPKRKTLWGCGEYKENAELVHKRKKIN